jgi:hypothetical protein
MRPFSLPLLLVLAVQFISAQKPGPGDPQVTLWTAIKTALQAADGDAYFESQIKNAVLPGGANGLHGLKGTVISSRPPDHPSEVVLAISDANTPEVTLKFLDKLGKADHLRRAITPGTRVAFAGVAEAYTKNPFMLTLETQIGAAPKGGFAVTVEALESAPIPVIPVNYPSRLASRFLNVSLEGLPERKFMADDHGIATKMTGVLLERLLQTAGWYRDAGDGRPRYVVQVEGAQSTFTLPDFVSGSLEERAWIIVAGPGDSKPEASLVIVRDGAVTQRVDAIRRVQVFEQH